jgi:poly(3-hydroxybutyrate) depolymerase
VRAFPGALSVQIGVLGVVLLAAGACTQSSSGSHDSAATGGAASGGTTGFGGTAPTGGSAGSGGTPGSGGASAAGGGAGGTRAEGGSVSTGGTTSAGGGTSAGGETGAGGRTSTTSSGGAAGTGGRTGAGGRTGTGGVTGTGGSADAGPPAKDTAEPVSDAAPADRGPGREDLAAADATDSALSTCPAGQAPPAAGNQKATLQHGGRSRTYTLHVPSGLTAGKALAVVIDLHGAGGNGSQQQGMSGWASLGDREGFLTVFPDGVDGYWNVDDKCCGTAGQNKIDDVGFLRAIIDKLRADICIDARRIYVSGFSNGGGLTHRMGCDAADVIAAIAPMATDLRTQPCNAKRPISMMEIRGMADSLEPYEGGMVGPAGGQYLAVGAKESLRLWAEINQCTDTAKEIEKYCEGHTACGDGVETDLCSLPNVDHSPYSNSLGFNVAATAWKMFQRQPMK